MTYYAVRRLIFPVLGMLLWLCSGCGGGSDSPILSVSATSISANHVLGGDKGSAQFTVTNSGGGSLSYTIQGSPRFLDTASRIQGMLLSGEDHIIRFTLDCDEPGIVADAVTIQGDNGTSETVLISVKCTAPPIVLQIEESPVHGTGTPVEALTVKMSWSFSSSWSGQGAVDYSVTSNHGQASAAPASGSAGLGDIVAVDLTYDCEALEHVTVVWTVSAAGQQMDTEWDVVCEAPPVAIAIDDLAGTVGTPLSFPSEILRWSFTSPWDGHGLEEYVIESNVELALADPASGSAGPGDPVAVKLTYQCGELDVLEVSWTLRIGDQHETMTWNIQCVAPPVVIGIASITLESSGILPDGATGLLRWSFTSEWQDHGIEPFEIRASDPRANAVPSRGSADPGEMITADLTYACDVPGAQAITWSVVIGEQHEEAELIVSCDAPAIILTIEDVEESSALTDEDADGQLMWFFTSPWGGQGPVDYTISTDDARTSIEPSRGSASPDEVVVGQLAFRCEEQGEFLVHWTIRAGRVEGGADWSVRCVEVSLSIEDVADSTALLPDPAQGHLRWSYSLNPHADLVLDFSMVTDDARASISPASGSAEPNEVVSADLTFACQDVNSYVIALTVNVAGRQEEVFWKVECAAPPIQITIEGIDDSSAFLEQDGVGQMRWSFTSPWDGQGALDYTITTGDANASASQSSGTASLGEVVDTTLSYACKSPGEYAVEWTISLGEAAGKARWNMQCIKIVIAIEQIDDSSALLPDDAETVLRWSFSSTAQDARYLEYSVAADHPQTSVRPLSGVAKHGDLVTIDLSFECQDVGVYLVNLHVNVANVREEDSWKVTCEENFIQIEVQEIADSTATLPTHPTGTMRWMFTSSESDQTSRNYSLSSSDSLVRFDPASGTAQPSENVNVALTYECTDPVNTAAPIVLSVDERSKTVSWNVTCKKKSSPPPPPPPPPPPIQIEVQEVADSTATLPTHPTGTMSWKFTSSQSDQTPRNYSLSSSDSLARFAPASGTARPSENVNVALTYECTNPVNTAVPIVLSVDGRSKTVSWNVECIAPNITIVIDDVADSTAELPTYPTETLSWKFTSSSQSDQTPRNYSLSSSDSLARFAPASGTARPSENVNVALTYECTNPVNTAVPIVLSVDGRSKTVSWNVECIAPNITIVIDDVADSTAELPTYPTETLSWKFTSSSQSDQTPRNYSLSSSDSLARFAPASGTARPSENVNVALTYECTNPANTAVPIVLSVDGRSKTVSWNVECIAPNITIVIDDVADSTAELPTYPTETLSWKFTSSSQSDQTPRNYSLSSSDSLARFAPASGTARPSENVNVALTYECTNPANTAVPIVLSVDGRSKTVSWNVECIAPNITIVIDDVADSTAELPTYPTETLSWKFTSSSQSDQTPRNYSLSSSDSLARFAPASGTARPSENVNVALTYECTNPANTAVPIVLSVDGRSKTVSWNVECIAPNITIVIDDVADSTAELPTYPTETLSWKFTSSSQSDQTPRNYSLSSSDSLARFAPASGTARPSENVNVALTYECTNPANTAVPIVLSVDGRSKTVSWNVECIAPNITIVIDDVADSTAELPTYPTETLSWKFTSSSQSDQTPRNYSLSSSDSLARFAPASGTARPSENVNVALTYECTNPVNTAVPIVLSVDGRSKTVSWNVECIAPNITIVIDDVADSTAELPTYPTETLSWKFTSSSQSDQTPRNYSLSSSDSLARFAPASGTARPSENVNVALTYECTNPVNTAVPIVLSVDGRSKTVSWNVECIAPNITIVIDDVADSTAELPTYPTETLSWKFTSSSQSDQTPRNYSLSSSDSLARFAPASGTARPSENVNVALTYECTNPVNTAVPIVLSVDGRSKTVSWNVECIAPNITIVIDDVADSSGKPTSAATGLLRWQFTSPWSGQGPVDYTVSTSDNRASAVPSQSTATKDVPQVINLSFDCQDLGDHSVTWMVRAGGVQAQATWNVKCVTELSIDIITDNIDATGTPSNDAEAELEWVLRSVTDAQDSYTYSISVNNARATADPSSGTATTNENITTALQYDCGNPKTSTTIAMIAVAQLTHDVSWQVECTAGVLRIGRLELFQTPMIARARRTEAEDGTVSFEEESIINAVTGRSATVAVTMEHETRDVQHRVAANVTLADDTKIPLQVYRISWRRARDSDAELWETDYVFFIDGTEFVNTTSLTVDLSPESTDDMRSIDWNFSNLNFRSIGAIKYKFFRLESPAGIPGKVTQSHVDNFMAWASSMHPIVEFSTTISDEVIRPDDPDDFDPVDLVLKLQAKWYADGATDDEYYYAVYLVPADDDTIGAAVISNNAAVGKAYRGSTLIHELGHNFSLYHSACGLTGKTDPNARPHGLIGPNRGWSTFNNIIVFPNAEYRDLMSYCRPYFPSDYTYRTTLVYLQDRLSRSSSARNIEASHPTNETSHTAVTKEGKPARSIALAGSIDALGNWTLGLQEYNQHSPSPVLNTGSYILKLLDSTGNAILTQTIETYQVSHSLKSAWGTRVRIPSIKPVELAIYNKSGSIVFQESLSL